VVAPVILLRSVVAYVDRFPVLAGVDLDVNAGDIVLLEGPNGAGKTSLLRLLAGLLPATDGEATVLGYDLLQDRRSVRRSIGFIGHDPFLYDDLTVKENVEFFVRAAAGDLSRVAGVLGRLGLDGRLGETPVGRASQGQRRRVALATLLIRDPQVWLLDEPHAGLDARTRDVVDEVIIDAASRGRAIVFSSHEHDRANLAAHRSVIIDGGTTQMTAGSHVA
jgi:heme ABC exporter ATP-binding subunit CcmA